MSRLKQFKLPDLGEGLTEGEILKWLVQPGDNVLLNQPIVEVETAKAAVEVPSPYAGVVTELLCGEGETVDVGSPIITVDTDPGAPPTPAPRAETVSVAESVEPGLIGGPAPGGRTSVLVGYGPKSVTAKRRERKAPQTTAEVAEHAVSTSDLAVAPARISAAEVGAAAQRLAGQEPALAKPPVRKLARDLGVDLHGVSPSGPDGTITRGDVTSAAGADSQATAPLRTPDFDPATREQRIPIKGVRKQMATAMVASAFTAPHVTMFTTVDATKTMRAVRRLKAMPGFGDLRVGPLLLVAKAVLLAVQRHPMVNSSWEEAAQEIVVKDYVNLGIAAATPRGLIVPNIKNADALSVRQLAEAMTSLVDIARDGRTSPADMAGGTITITNVGVFGVDTGTPILNPGESAILALGAVREQPWVHKGKVKPRLVTQLALAFDHRIIDGQLGARFLADLAAVLHDPEAALLAWT